MSSGASGPRSSIWALYCAEIGALIQLAIVKESNSAASPERHLSDRLSINAVICADSLLLIAATKRLTNTSGEASAPTALVVPTVKAPHADMRARSQRPTNPGMG